MQCPGPIMAVAKTLKEAAVGDEQVVEETEKSFARDIDSFCRKMGQAFMNRAMAMAGVATPIEMLQQA